MLLVLDNACKIDARKQAYEASGAFKVVGLEVTLDDVCCFQDGLSLLGVRREQVELNRPPFQGFAESGGATVSLRC